MRPSDFFRSILSVGEFMSHMNTATDVVSAMLGKEPPPDASATVKGAFGIFGRGDERAFEILLTQAEEKLPGARAIVAGFRQWARLKGTSWEVRAANAWYDNAFRNHFLGMGASDGKVTGSDTTTTTTVDSETKAKTVVVKKRDIRSDSTNQSLKELLVMCELIKTAPTLEEGYVLVTEQTGIPRPSKATAKTVKGLQKNFAAGIEHGKETVKELNDWFGKQVDEQEETRWWLRRWIDKYLG